MFPLAVMCELVEMNPLELMSPSTANIYPFEPEVGGVAVPIPTLNFDASVCNITLPSESFTWKSTS